MDGRRPGFNMFQPCSFWSGSRWGSARVKSAILSLGWLMAVLFLILHRHRPKPLEPGCFKMLSHMVGKCGPPSGNPRL